MEEALDTSSKAIGNAGGSWIPKGTVTIGRRLYIISCGDLEHPEGFLNQQNNLRGAIWDDIRASLPVAQATNSRDEQVHANVILQQRVQECGIVVQVVLAIPGTILVDPRISVPGE